MSKKAHFFAFSADGSKKSVTLWAKYLIAFERSNLVASEIVMDYWVLSYH